MFLEIVDTIPKVYNLDAVIPWYKVPISEVLIVATFPSVIDC